MTTTPEFGLGPWQLDPPDPLTLVVVGISADSCAQADDIASRIKGASVIESHAPSPDDGVTWLASLNVNGMAAPLLCWPEVIDANDIDLSTSSDPQQSLVVQTLLDPDDPLTCLCQLLKLLVLIDDQSGGILDAETGRWLERDIIMRDLVDEEIEPNEDLLWMVTAESQEDGHLIRTSGLRRSGHAELQIENIRDDQVDAAASLMGSIAGLCMESILPEHGTVIEIGPGLNLRVMSASDENGQAVASFESAGETSITAILDHLQTGMAAIYQTQRSTERLRLLAQSSWATFLKLIPLATERGGACYVEVTFEDPEGEEYRREHLWMSVERCDDDGVIAIPAQEAMIAEGIAQEPCLIRSNEIANWTIVIDEDTWGPEQCAALKDLLNEGNA